MTSFEERRRLASLDRASVGSYQLGRFNRLLEQILPANSFYAAKLAGKKARLEHLDELGEYPFTTKDELHPESPLAVAANCTYDSAAYLRYHQTSGTRGRPLPIRDTPSDWAWWVECWQYVLDMAQIERGERAMLAFSFGPFIGFWSAFDALVARGVLAVPGGGMSSLARIDLMERMKTTSLFCTPTYALRLAEVAAENQIALDHLPIKKVVVAGEPGGSVPAIRQQIEQTWNATVIDHAGASEVGAWGVGDSEGRGMYVIESEFIAEFLSVETGAAANDGELAQLVLTSLGRVGAPIIRYRTGDLVRPRWNSTGFVHLEGGVLGRTDDMMVIRGVNIFPTAIEQILRGFPEVVEYRMTARKVSQLDALTIEVEDRMQEPSRIAAELQRRLGLKVEVRLAPTMSLPRFEGKGRRFIDQRK